jgi:hypothetical protein
MTLCIGCVPVASTGNADRIIWLDVNSTVPVVMAANLGIQVLEEAVTRAFDFVYAVYVAYLEPSLIFGLCDGFSTDFAANCSLAVSSRQIGNASVAANLT